MNKRKTPQQYSKGKLRDLAVILAAHQILHMVQNEHVKKISEEKDIPLDIPDKKIASLEKIAMSILQSNKIHRDDNSFFVEKCGIILETFFDRGIAERGVSPEIAFATILFTNFVDNNGKSHSPEFASLCEPGIYDNVFDHLEYCDGIDWWDHYHTSLLSLARGIGISLQYRLPDPVIPPPQIFNKKLNETPLPPLRAA